MENKEILKNCIEHYLGVDEFKNVITLWNLMNTEVFRLTDAPYPVKHGEQHIINVIINISNVLKCIGREKVSKHFEHNLPFLYYAAIIHDLGMKIVPLDTEEGIDTARSKHADYELIYSELSRINITNPILIENKELICHLASSHANSYTKQSKLVTIDEKIENLVSNYAHLYPDIKLYSKILQFADLIDIDRNRLNNVDPFVFKKKQFKHYFKHDIFSVEINHETKIISLNQKEKVTSLNQYELQELRKEISKEISQQFEKLQNYFTYGWKLNLPNGHENINFPQERRIRIQASHTCNLDCQCCHHDQFNIKNISPDYKRLVKLINNIKTQENGGHIYPLPNISFTITGGEPFENTDEIENIIKSTYTPNLSNGEQNSTYLLTNALHLDDNNILLLNRYSLNKIRISLNYERNNRIRKEQERFQKIKNLIANNNLTEIRINHVVVTGKLAEIDNIYDRIQSELGSFIPKNIKEIGFIQESNNTAYDIFELATQYKKSKKEAIKDIIYLDRKIIFDLHRNLKISFIKLNCDIRADSIKRCFSCVREQDINITSDGRIRLCSGWNENLNPKFQDVQFDINYPLIGIANGIKKKYGIAGFYGHFPSVIEVVNKRKKTDIAFRINELRDIIIRYKNPISNNFDDVLQKTIDLITSLNSPFKYLYNEGIVQENEIDETIKLCICLIKALYKYGKTCSKDFDKIRINKILLILSYLTIDESLFSTGRTIIVKGLAEKLLFSFNSMISSLTTSEEDTLIYTTYCIATVALENIESEIVLEYINTMLNIEKQIKYGQIPYLLGCIYRQLKQKDKAIESFNTAFSKSSLSLLDENDNYIFLNKEIRADSQRSLGAIKKSDLIKSNETQQHFLLSRYYSSIDNTILKYHTLFSDGYSLLLRFFEEEFLDSPKTYSKNLGLDAYIQLKESVDINSNFYASLIRLALLDLAFNIHRLAYDRIKLAHVVFNKLGLLTDQEYLNRILSNLVYLYAKFKMDAAPIDVTTINEFVEFNIRGCNNVGVRDIECVIEDVIILKLIILKSESPEIIETDLVKIVNAIEIFIKECKMLIKDKKAKLMILLENKFKISNQGESEKILKEIEELKNDGNFREAKKNKLAPNEIHHVCIQTNKYEDSLRFYTEYLGAKILLKNENFHGRKYNTWLLLGNIKIELQTPKENQEFINWSNLNSGPVHLCFVVNDVQKMYNQIKTIQEIHGETIGFKTRDGKTEIYEVQDKGFKIFKVKAPEGTEIEIRDTPNID